MLVWSGQFKSFLSRQHFLDLTFTLNLSFDILVHFFQMWSFAFVENVRRAQSQNLFGTKFNLTRFSAN